MQTAEQTAFVVSSGRTADRVKELERIIGLKQDWLFRFAYLRVGKREDAEDIVQDVLLRLYRSKERLTHIDDVERYLVHALRNACIDYIRRRPPILMTSLEGAAQIAEDSEADKEIRDEYERINRLLQTIPTEQAEIVRLHCTDGLTFRQIAQVLEIPEATVKSRYRYAIDKIRKAYEDDE
ncbi:MAG: sigma-70 family RNA polymerase sigma factor [Bacteroidaceae bacterium]|nr:sigma-70 family RNA polymerase sigma factor [Bacteroidaceae bacterium]